MTLTVSQMREPSRVLHMAGACHPHHPVDGKPDCNEPLGLPPCDQCGHEPTFNRTAGVETIQLCSTVHAALLAMHQEAMKPDDWELSIFAKYGGRIDVPTPTEFKALYGVPINAHKCGQP